MVVPQTARPNGCNEAVLRVPARALADSFVLTGQLVLDGASGAWGVGDMALLELHLGEIHFLGGRADGSAGGTGITTVGL